MNNIDIQILVGGKPVKQHFHDGRAFVEARFGNEYSIKIRNSNHFRVEAVVSVDGVDVINGKQAEYSNAGYIINPYSSIEIKGFRKDLDTVGAFKFTKKKKAYAKEATGSAQNVGVIGVACFRESTPLIKAQGRSLFADGEVSTWKPLWTMTNHHVNSGGQHNKHDAVGSVNVVCDSLLPDSNISASNSLDAATTSYTSTIICGASNASFQNCVLTRSAPQFEAGTTWGAKLNDKVETVNFVRQDPNHPMAVLNVYYDTRKSLEKIGIDFEPQKKVAQPQAFPQAFARPPAGW